MLKEEDKQLFRLLFPEVRYCSGDELESWYAYAARELVEAKIEKREKWEVDQLNAWVKVIDEERGRRLELAKHGAPAYTGEDRIPAGRVEALKRYYTGDAFINLFQKVTGFEIFPSSSGRMKYRCGVHGDDKNPSGVLYLDKGRYYCFACNAGGDIFQLLYSFPPHLTFIQAVRQFTEWSRLPDYVQTKEGKWRRS